MRHRINERRIRIQHHDMEVFDGPDTAEGNGVLEPDQLVGISTPTVNPQSSGHMLSRGRGRNETMRDTYLLPRHVRPKHVLHKRLNQSLRLSSGLARRRIRCEERLGPHDQMSDARIDAVGPVIAQDLDIGGGDEWRAGLGRQIGPAESLG
jgi:hypothetical protein